MRTRMLVTTLILLLPACGTSPTAPTSPIATPSPPTFHITGFVSQFEVIPTSSGRFADINYEVTITSSHQAAGCFIRVNWLNENDLQIGFTYLTAATVTVPAGMSRITDQDFENIATALRIRDSRVVFSNCVTA